MRMFNVVQRRRRNKDCKRPNFFKFAKTFQEVLSYCEVHAKAPRTLFEEHYLGDQDLDDCSVHRLDLDRRSPPSYQWVATIVHEQPQKKEASAAMPDNDNVDRK
ncbi:hypothetical protein AAMO2058_001019500 [Amorphochlora amoebiformis]